MLYYNFSYGQALKVNWAYTNNQREDTSGYFRLSFFFILLIDFVACWVPFINIHMFFSFMHFKNHQDTSIYLLVIWVQRLLMQHYLRASQYILVVREFIPLNISFYTILSWVGTRQGLQALDFLMTTIFLLLATCPRQKVYGGIYKRCYIVA